MTVDLASLVTLGVIVLLWVAAAAFGTDSRDGRDWFSRTNLRERPRRMGD